ncbi:hypothetical protein [Nocardia callitridis]|uniref:Uncharacterized protein n=1 Tax=Nocardia callitridis TaxID=648753 RepID=A0ABP9K7N8_9NOCA
MRVAAAVHVAAEHCAAVATGGIEILSFCAYDDGAIDEGDIGDDQSFPLGDRVDDPPTVGPAIAEPP